MNKKIQIVLSTIIVIFLFGIQVSYALSTNEDVGFFEVSANEIASGETLEMTFNLDKIEYDNFKIILNSNINTGKIYTDEDITIEEDSDAIAIEVDKNKLNLSEIKLCYAVTENMDLNTIIQLKAQVHIDEEVEIQDDEDNTVTQIQDKVALEESQNVTIVEEIKNENTENDNRQKDSNQKDTDSKNSKGTDSEKINEVQKENNQNQNEKNTGIASKALNSNENMSQESSQNLRNTNAKSGNTNMSSSSASGMQSSSQSKEKTENATYNGSNNNYLKKLKVKGLELNTTFNKENTTYFVNVTDTSSLKITATAEDDTAKVVVTGNDSISEGTNKILIAVTADNGDVRYYRIFVNCQLS